MLKMKDKDKVDPKIKREVINIEIDWDSEEDLIGLADNENFVDFILEETLKAIIDALKNNKEKAELFNVFNMSVIIELKKSQFKTVLEKINDMLIRNEEYERCSQLKKLIKNHNL
tara:strand:+ start:2114 stop:2458 length:345 start_codon:yes stop_codon:yes gene_type:complete